MKTKKLHPNNLNFIATYLFHNPGAGYTEILKALCGWLGNEYRSGLYTCYLSDMSFGPNCGRYRGNLWHKQGVRGGKGGYLLTLKGMARVIPDMNMESQHG